MRVLAVLFLLLLSVTILPVSAVVNDPVLWWKFDETSGTTVSDSVGSTTGTFTGNTNGWLSGASCKFSGCLNMHPTDGGISFSKATGSTFTWASWIYALAAGANDYAGMFHLGASGIFLDQSGTNNNKLNYYYTTDHFSTGTITRDTWTHVAIVNNAGAVTFYINATASGTAASAPGFTATALGFNSTGTQFVGRFDDMRLYNRALSGAEITELRDWTPSTGTTRRAIMVIQ